MAIQIIKIFTCDICKIKKEVRTITIPVRWITEQNEGRDIRPYITTETKDICNECLDKVTRINVRGAQGHNTYTII